MKLSKLAPLVVFMLPLSANELRAAAIEWQFLPIGDDNYFVGVAVYGDDNRGIAEYALHAEGLEASGISPDTLSWSPSVAFGTLEVTREPGVFSVTASQVLAPNPTFDIGLDGQGFRNTIELGVLTIPGSAGASITKQTFRESSVKLFSVDAQTLPTTDVVGRTLEARRVSSSYHGGNVIADYIYRVTPGDHIVDFGQVPVETIVFDDIIALVNHGFGGPFFDVTALEISGASDSMFDVVEFEPGRVTNVATYDVAFSPDRPGLFESKLEFYIETEFFGAGVIPVNVKGLAVPEPSSPAMMVAFVATGLFCSLRRRPTE